MPIIYINNDDIRLNSSSSDKVVVNGSLGIGTTSPARKLDISDNGIQFRLGFSSSLYTDFYSTSAGGLAIYPRSNQPVYIGTDSQLQVETVDSSTDVRYGGSVLRLANSYSALDNIAAIDFPQSAAGTGFSRIGVQYKSRTASAETQDMYFVTMGGGASSEKMRITGAGNVGIGTTSPNNFGFLERALHISAGSASSTTLQQAALIIQGSSDADDAVDFGYLAFTNYQSTLANNRVAEIRALRGDTVDKGQLTFFTANGATVEERLRITPTGNVGIGTTSPGYKLSIDDSSVSSTPKTLLQLDGSNITDNGGYNIDFRTSTSDTADRYIARIQGVRESVGALSKLSFWTESGTALEERMTIRASGNVGIGTTSPSQKLEIHGNVKVGDASADNYVQAVFSDGTETRMHGYGFYMSRTNSYIRPTNDGSQILVIGTENNTWNYVALDTNYFTVSTNASEHLRVTNTGNVGIGTTSPITRLHVGDNTTGITVRIQNSNAGNEASLRFQALSSTSTQEYADIALDPLAGDGALVFRNPYTSERLRITSDGNVGIGSTVPAAKLHVIGSSTSTDLAMRVANNNNTQLLQVRNDGFVAINHSSFDYTLDVQKFTNENDDTIINIRSNWANTSTNKGIGSLFFTAYDVDVDSGATKTAGGIRVFAENEWTSAANSNAYMTLNTLSGGSFGERMRITASGNVGIGTASPSAKLHVDGDSLFDGNILIGSTYTQTAGSGWTTSNSQLILGGAHNAEVNNDNPGVKLLITGYDNDLSTPIYPIYAEDENGLVDFWIKNRQGDSNLPTMYFAGNVGIGVVPKTGGSTWQHIQFGGTGNIIGRISDSTVDAMFANNYYVNSSNVDSHITTGAATRVFLNDGEIRFDTAPSAAADAAATFTNRLFIANTGNVGIGTTSPDSPLTVTNNAVSSYIINVNMADDVDGGGFYEATGGMELYLKDTSGTGQVKLTSSGLSYLNGGNVGIGTDSPSSKLEVKGASGTLYDTQLKIVASEETGAVDTGGSLSFVGHDGNAARTHAAVRGLKENSTVGNYSGYLSFDTRENNAALSEKMRILGNGNVGIGTTNPTTKLYVDAGESTFNRGNSDGAIARFRGKNAEKAVIGTVDSWFSSNVGIGTTSPTGASGRTLAINGGAGQARLALKNDSTGDASGDGLQIVLDATIGGIEMRENLPLSFSTNNTEQMRITSGGNVGIGTTSPDSKFHVEDTNPEVRITGTGGTSFPRILWEYPVSATQASRWALTSSASGNTFYLYNYTQSKKVLQVDGTASHITLNHDAAGTTQIGTSTTQTAYQLYVATNVGQTGAIEASGSVKITSGALGVNIAASATAGRIDASNDIVAYSTSDKRLKENIKPIENALDKVKSLTGVEFDWIEETKHVHGYEGHDVGVIAQEVQEVLPEAIRTNDSGYLSVRYEKMIALLVEANKELAARVELLEQKLKQ